MQDAPKKQSAETGGGEKEYTFEEFLKAFGPDVELDAPDESSDTPSQIGRDIASEILRELQENLAKGE
jgi:hypothetical protein